MAHIKKPHIKKLLAITAMSVAMGAYAQKPTPPASFQKFREEVLGNYQNFRKEVLDNYSKFLQGVWDDYDGFRGLERDSVPKPSTPPIMPDNEDEPEIDLPTPEVEDTPVYEPDPEPQTVVPDKHDTPVAQSSTSVIDYYGMPIEMKLTKFRISDFVADEAAYGKQWQRLHSDGLAIKQANILADKAKELGLNGYLTFQLVKKWVDSTYPEADASSRISLQHYLINMIGYEARISLTSKREPVLLIPFKQIIYGRPGIVINNQRYYVFPDNDKSLKNLDGHFSTCRLPTDADLGVVSSLVPKKLNLPWKPKKYHVEHGGIVIDGEINANYTEILRHYPLIDINQYPLATIDPDLRQSVVNQIRPYIEGMSQKDAVNKLLSFVQEGFEYATDHEFHGYEKPYFFEEMLLWDKCDCEDRAIFYSYLLWNLLGVENHMLRYPGHESVGVYLPDLSTGIKYAADGKDFYISDPTYIGSITGHCMPKYISAKPKIDYHYK